MTSRMRDHRGVVAVEFAFIAPLLLALIMGAVEFGDRYKTTAIYNNAALVAARTYSFSNDSAKATADARDAGLPASVTPIYSFSFNSGDKCKPDADGTYPNVTVTVTRTGIPAVTPLPALLPGMATTFSITGKAVARCAA